MTILLTRDPAAFADRAGDFLQTRVECNILATVLAAVRGGTLAGREELFAEDPGLDAVNSVAARVRMDAGGAFFWEHEGRPVSLVAVNPAVAGVARVGPVYTPPPERGRGYAGSAVATLSRRVLAEGARRCALFTDLANPTSNKIYAEVGYRRLCDWEMIALGPAGDGR